MPTAAKSFTITAVIRTSGPTWRMPPSSRPSSRPLRCTHAAAIANDIGETKNLAATETTRTAELLEELNRWRVTVGAEKMFPNPNFDPSEVPAKKSKTK